MWLYSAVPHRPGRPSTNPPSDPPLPYACASSTLPWCTGQCRGALCSVYIRAPAYRIRGTVNGGGFPPAKWWRYPGHAGRRNDPASLSSLRSVPDTPRWGSSAVPRRSGRLSCSYVAPHRSSWFPNTVTHPLHSHAASVDGPPETWATSPPCTLWNVPKPAASPGRKAPLLSSLSTILPLLGKLEMLGPPHRGRLCGWGRDILKEYHSTTFSNMLRKM